MSKIVEGILKDIKAIPKNFVAPFRGGDIKKVILLNIPYIITGYVANKIAWLYRLIPGDMSAKMTDFIGSIGTAFKNPLPSFEMVNLLIGIGAGVGFKFFMVPYHEIT